MLINIALSFLFVRAITASTFLSQSLAGFLKIQNIKGIAVLGLPLAISLASIINLAWHWFDLKKHTGDFGISDIKKSFLKIIIASILCGLFTYSGLYIFSLAFNTRTTFGLFLQTLSAFLLGGAAYLITAFLFKAEEIKMFNIGGTLFNWRGAAKPEPIGLGEALDDQY